NYKEYYDVVTEQFQSSIITLMSSPIKFQDDKINNIAPYAVIDVTKELTKEVLNQLRVTQPDYLLIDFWADNHFGVVKIGKSQYVTNNRWRILLT
ncbi:DUF6270 domain-containing protein, partial [Mycobacterium kansasii]